MSKADVISGVVSLGIFLIIIAGVFFVSMCIEAIV